MDIEIPNWLSKKFLKQILQNQKKDDNIEINKYVITRCVPKGNNYLSSVLRINIDYQNMLLTGDWENKKISLIVKIPLVDESLAALMKTGIVEREVEAYYDLIPKINDILLTDKDNSLTPICYKCDVEGILIMEDLIASGYKMVDKREQMDYDHGVAALKHLAKFHAASVRLHEEDPNLVEKIGRHLLYNKNMDPDVKSVLDPVQGKEHLEMLSKEFNKWPDTKKYVPFITKLAPKFWDIMLEAIDSYDEEFVALNHADAYTSNIFFDYDEQGNISDVKYIDFQMLRYTCPVMDLIYFIHTSIKYDVIDAHYEELTQCYLDNLNSYLEKYGSAKRWKHDDFKKSLERREIFTLIICIIVLPFMFAGSKDFSDNNETPEYPYFDYSKNEKFRKTCVKFLDKYSNLLQNFE